MATDNEDKGQRTKAYIIAWTAGIVIFVGAFILLRLMNDRISKAKNTENTTTQKVIIKK